MKQGSGKVLPHGRHSDCSISAKCISISATWISISAKWINVHDVQMYMHDCWETMNGSLKYESTFLRVLRGLSASGPDEAQVWPRLRCDTALWEFEFYFHPYWPSKVPVSCPRDTLQYRRIAGRCPREAKLAVTFYQSRPSLSLSLMHIHLSLTHTHIYTHTLSLSLSL